MEEKDSFGRERVAYAKDFKDVSITFTAEEWSALLEFFEYRKKYSPSTFHKTTKIIYQKLIANKPHLKEGLSEVNDSSYKDKLLVVTLDKENTE